MGSFVSLYLDFRVCWCEYSVNSTRVRSMCLHTSCSLCIVCACLLVCQPACLSIWLMCECVCESACMYAHIGYVYIYMRTLWSAYCYEFYFCYWFIYYNCDSMERPFSNGNYWKENLNILLIIYLYADCLIHQSYVQLLPIQCFPFHLISLKLAFQKSVPFFSDIYSYACPLLSDSIPIWWWWWWILHECYQQHSKLPHNIIMWFI